MIEHPAARIVRGKRTVAEFAPAFVWESSDPSNPLHGHLVNASDQSIVVSNGRTMIHALRTELRTL